MNASARNDDMERRYRAGETLQQIGARYGITRERVRQILAKRGVAADAGGSCVRSAARIRLLTERRAAARSARCLRLFGCTYEQYRSVVEPGWSQSEHPERTPMGAFVRQRCTARARGIAWGFTFWAWWQVWEASGHWAERGRGHGYAMSRIGDAGPYSPENVRIVRNSENVAEYYDRERAIYGRVRSGQERKAA